MLLFFEAVAPKLWNGLPLPIRSAKRLLKMVTAMLGCAEALEHLNTNPGVRIISVNKSTSKQKSESLSP